MSETNISLEIDLEDSDYEIPEEDPQIFVQEIVNEAIDSAVTRAEGVSTVNEILDDILGAVCPAKKAALVLSSSSSESEQSSYHEPSYLAIRSKIDITGEEEAEREEDRPHTCKQYQGVDNCAQEVVDEILEKAIEGVMKMGFYQEQEEQEEEEVGEESTFSWTISSTINWPTIEEFTADAGLEKIYELLETWDYDEGWLYCVDFLLQQSDECSDFYKYEARWSIPTEMYPVPQATASIYFTIEASRVLPSHCPVTVTYVYEGTSFEHTLESIFSEDRLFEIVDAKLKFCQRLTF